jgi:hypothetical protein
MRRAHGPGTSPLMVFALVFLIMVGVGSVATIAAVTAVVGSMLAPLAAVAGGVALIHLVSKPRRRRLRASGPGVAPLPPRRPTPPRRVATPPRPDLVWAHVRSRFHALRAAYVAYECDAMEILRLPALSDVSVPSTGRFVDAFAEAQALETDAFPPPEHALAFHTAVDRAERAWHAARDAAERIRLSGLTPEERRTVERVVKLLTTARDSDSEPERLAAYAMARSELARLDSTGVVHIPLPATAALNRAAQGQLPA